MVTTKESKKIDSSLGVVELGVEELFQLAEGDKLNMDAIFTTPDLVSKLIPIAQVLHFDSSLIPLDFGTEKTHAIYQTRNCNR